MVEAYEQLHALGVAHSVETWVDDKLVGGLYFVALGKAVFGESMFAHATDASKIALAALVCMAKRRACLGSTVNKTPDTWHPWAQQKYHAKHSLLTSRPFQANRTLSGF